MDISTIDLDHVEKFASMVISLTEYRKELQQYLKNKMFEIAPNMSALIGEQVRIRPGNVPELFMNVLVILLNELRCI